MVTLGHLWYNSGTHFVGLPSVAQSGMTSCQDDQDYPALGLMYGSPHILTTITLGLMYGSPHILTTIQSAHFYRMGHDLS